VQRQRSLNSPAGNVSQNVPLSRQNSFSGQDVSGFPGPTSPVGVIPHSQTNFANAVFSNQQMQRMQRQSNTPQATQHLPGKLFN